MPPVGSLIMAISCDGCGKELPRGRLRYTVRINVIAAVDDLEINLLDLVRDHRSEIQTLVDQMSQKESQELEDGVYKSLHLDLCPACQKAYLRSPLRFRTEEGDIEPAMDVEAFLRSLGKKPPSES
jgi:hypothetical protein